MRPFCTTKSRAQSAPAISCCYLFVLMRYLISPKPRVEIQRIFWFSTNCRVCGHTHLWFMTLPGCLDSRVCITSGSCNLCYAFQPERMKSEQQRNISSMKCNQSRTMKYLHDCEIGQISLEEHLLLMYKLPSSIQLGIRMLSIHWVCVLKHLSVPSLRLTIFASL